MALPKVRQTKSRRNKRRAHHALKKIPTSFCPSCKEPVLSHTVCKNCGTYKQNKVIDVLAKLDKKEKKKKAKVQEETKDKE